MKRNVDLTENMMFSQESNIHHSINIFEKSSNYALRKFPWEFSKEQLSQKDKMIVLGNASEREMFYSIRKAVSNVFCDCCGKEIGTLPWRGRLCLKCQSLLEQQLSERCPWRENT